MRAHLWPVLAVVAALAWQESRYARNGRDQVHARGDLSQPLLLLSFILALSACLHSFLLGWWLSPAITAFWPGLGLFVAGLAVRLHAIRTLGRFFTGHVVVRADHALIQAGLYRWVRHPSYLGAVLEVLGCVLMSGSTVGLAILGGAYLPALVYRIRVEERALAERFGERYRSYAATTKAVIPFLL